MFEVIDILRNLCLYVGISDCFSLLRLMCIAIAWCFGLTSVMAQCAEQFIALDSEDGLSQNTVYSILQDDIGYLWVGTQDGLNRYDGRVFTQFRRDDSPTSLSDNFTTDLEEDRAGNIWITTRDGANRLNPETGQFTQFFAGENQQYSNSTSISVHEDNVVIPFTGKLMFGNSASQKLNTIQTGKANHISASTVHRGSIILASQRSFLRLSDTNEIQHVIDFPDSLAINSLVSMHDALWILHQDGAIRWNGEDTFETVIEGPWCTSVYEYEPNVFWLGTWSGLLKLENDLTTNTWTTLNPVLPGIPINDILEDREGNVWTGSIGHGLLMFPASARQFKILGTDDAEGMLVWSILDTPRNLFLGTSSGLVVMEKESTDLDWMSLDKLSDGIRKKQVLLKGIQVTGLTEKEGVLWITTTKDQGLYRSDLETQRLENLAGKYDICSDRIFHIRTLRDSAIAISTIQGLTMINADGSESACIKPSELHPAATVVANYIIHCEEDRDGTLWLSTTSGLLNWDRGKNMSSYKNNKGDSTSLSYDMVSGSHKARDGGLWVSTLDRGLNYLDRQTGRFTRYNVNHGLKNDMCYSALPDRNGKVWTSHNEGISCLDPERGIFRNYGIEDGLDFLEFSQNAYYSDGERMWFGGTDGVVCIDPQQIDFQLVERPTIVNDLHLNYEPFPRSGNQLIGGLRSPEGIRLLPGDRALTIELSALDFSQKPLQFQYMLEGYDPAWIDKPDYDAVAHFTSLPYGDYVFKARHSNPDGTWSAISLEFPVQVIPPFWMTWWFISLAILFSLLLTAWIARNLSQRRLKARLRDIEMQQKLHKERERISMDLHDNVGSEITHVITSLDTLSYKMAQNKVENASQKIEDLSDFARGTMTQLRDTIWAINKDAVSVEEFTSRVNDFAQKMLGEKEGIKYHVRNHGDPLIELNPAHTINLYRIVQESINNILKHADAELIAVEIYSSKSEIRVQIIDDGVGIDFDKDTTGHYGLINMKNRMKALGGTCTITSRVGAGATVALSLPLE